MDQPLAIQLKIGEVVVPVELNGSATARGIADKLPFDSSVSRWGDEVFFETPVTAVPGPETTDINSGDVCFYHPKKMLCVFFGRTPASEGDKPVPAGPVEVIGKTSASAGALRTILEGERVNVSLPRDPAHVRPQVLPSPGPAVSSGNPYGERKLSQTEIDDLVKRLLEEKKKAAGS